MTLAISMLDNIFTLHTKTQNYLLEYPMCYAKYQNVIDFEPKHLLMLTNRLLVAINEHDTLRPLGIQFRPFTNSAGDTKYHKQSTWLHQNKNLFE